METRFAINAFHICLYSDEFEFTSKLNLLLDDHVKNMLFYVLAYIFFFIYTAIKKEGAVLLCTLAIAAWETTVVMQHYSSSIC